MRGTIGQRCLIGDPFSGAGGQKDHLGVRTGAVQTRGQANSRPERTQMEAFDHSQALKHAIHDPLVWPWSSKLATTSSGSYAKMAFLTISTEKLLRDSLITDRKTTSTQIGRRLHERGAPVAPVSPSHPGARPEHGATRHGATRLALQTQKAWPDAQCVRPGQVTPLRACCGKPLDLRNLLGDDATDVLRLGHHAIRLKEAVVAATVANRGNVNARVL